MVNSTSWLNYLKCVGIKMHLSVLFPSLHKTCSTPALTKANLIKSHPRLPKKSKRTRTEGETARTCKTEYYDLVRIQISYLLKLFYNDNTSEVSKCTYLNTIVSQIQIFDC